jgi:hypothetical protein
VLTKEYICNVEIRMTLLKLVKYDPCSVWKTPCIVDVLKTARSAMYPCRRGDLLLGSKCFMALYTDLCSLLLFAQTSSPQSLQWLPDLITMGYGEPLPAPVPAVQATLATLDAPPIHEYIQTQDRGALLEIDEEGEHPPLLLTTLDVSQWTIILALASEDCKKGMARLTAAHAELNNILLQEEEEYNVAVENTTLVDVAL